MMKKIAVVGSGYVGLVTVTCLADFGLNVMCVDTNNEKINMLKEGNIPIYEPGLEDLVKRNMYYKRLSFTTDIKKAVEEAEVIFIAVGTPPADDGSADMIYVRQVAQSIGQYINDYKIVVNKSTVPVGTGETVKNVIYQTMQERGAKYEFDIVSNPEFLREGSAIYDFTHPDRVVIGTNSDKARETMKSVYRVLNVNQVPFVFTNIETAEMIKYASNAFLALKITFINEIANLCEKVGANVQEVANAMGKDGRISPKFLHAGPGYGGSCFPKDTKALADIGKKYNSRLTLIEKTIEANENQKRFMVEKIKEAMGGVSGKTLAVLGLSFKPNTDDVRESPAITIIEGLISSDAKIKTFDPQGMAEAKWRLEKFQDSIEYAKDEYEAAVGSDGIVIVTEWHQFRNMDLNKLSKEMKGNYFFDLRNVYDQNHVEGFGFNYYSVGK
jgi:UDPglucose 6-dehydrogenase